MRRSGTNPIFRKHVMFPSDHGSWVFLLSPLLIGLVIGGRFTIASALLVIAALAAFLLRQPLTMIVKVRSGRRPRTDLDAALFWTVVYSLVGLLAVAGLLLLGDGFILLLAVPAIPIFSWHLWLVSRRAERNQMKVELAGSAVLALAAPAAYWVGSGAYDPIGWLIWGLVWMQIAGSIVYTYFRLKQRRLDDFPNCKESLRMAIPALVVNSGILLMVIILAAWSITPPWLPLAYVIQWIEVLWGIFHPAVGVKPTAIGVRQLIVSILFTLAFILAWI
jgi:hypothetical protein